MQQTDYGAYTGRPTADLLKPKGDIQNQNQCSKCSSYQTLPEEFISGGCIDIVGVQQFQLAVRIQLIQLIGNLCLPFYGQAVLGGERQRQGLVAVVQAFSLLYIDIGTD